MTSDDTKGDESGRLPAVGTPGFFHAVVETAVNPYVVIDDDLVLRYASPSIELLLGWDPVDWIGRNVAELLTPESLQLAVAGLAEIDLASHDPKWIGSPVRLFLTDIEGVSIPVDAYARESARTDVPGTLVQLVRAGASQTLSDAVDAILEGHDLERALELLTSLIEHDITDTAAMLGSGWDGNHFNQVAGRDRLLFLTSLQPTDRDGIARILGSDHNVADLFDDLAPETRAAARRRGWQACWVAPVPNDDGTDPTAALFIWRTEPGPPGVVFRDDIKRSVGLTRLALRWMGQQQVLNWMASHDQLTGLTNRSEFQNRLDESNGSRRAVLFCDLDDFKPVNENIGHRAGDRILTAVGARLKRVCADCIVARVGGDEFAILLHGVTGIDEARSLAAAVQKALVDPIVVDGRDIGIGVTIGLAYDSTGGVESDRLMDEADRLLREGKTAGKGQILSISLDT